MITYASRVHALLRGATRNENVLHIHRFDIWNILQIVHNKHNAAKRSIYGRRATRSLVAKCKLLCFAARRFRG